MRGEQIPNQNDPTRWARRQGLRHALRHARPAVFLLCALFVVAGCARSPEPLRLEGHSMGTGWTVLIGDPGAEEARARPLIEAELSQVVAQMSTWEPDSDLSRFNAAAAGTQHPVPAQLQDVVKAALALAEDSGGAFDPTVGPLVELWGFGPGRPRQTAPTPAEVDALRSRIGWQHVQIEEGRLIQPGGLSLDLSAIAKGHAVDRIAATLRAAGYADLLVEVGGELRAHGQHPGGRPWRVGLEGPSGERATGGLVLRDLAVATSGDYRQYFEEDGRRYSHMIDPRTGRPIAQAGIAVSVVHASCMQADGLATALSVLGPEQGFEWARERGIAARFVYRSQDTWAERTTPAFAALQAAE
ncbi:FAD:protein FMN transferase [Aquimonas voraii]|uniref:FAD:protein FMN transferase n=1 Tax=Aquimonas voraii TaxID=265719 RepID=A0A1G6YD20_9GAMM|nr:FAD:protein FMN transferase [Aquimonas voraii]SDD88279.1 thiamine biosynthesis lipoprotein [Aquimonas voraii]